MLDKFKFHPNAYRANGKKYDESYYERTVHGFTIVYIDVTNEWTVNDKECSREQVKNLLESLEDIFGGVL